MFGRNLAGARDAVAGQVTRIRRRGALLLRQGRQQWRRSLKLRVAATTLLVSGVVVLFVGAVLLNQISAVLLDSKEKAALQETRAGVDVAQTEMGAVDDAGSTLARNTILKITDALSKRSGSAGQFDLVLMSFSNPGFTNSGGRGVERRSIPQDLESLVRQGELAFRYGPIYYNGTEEHTAKGLLVGGAVETGNGRLGLFYFFPLDAEESSINEIERTVYVAGLAIMLLVAGISVLVTQQVVRPVRQAAQTASRFAEGHLEERMQVRGEDDLALLASRFNEMADSLQRQITKLEELSRLQRRFTSDVSHELRTPLTTVRMAADVLHSTRADFPPEVARSAELLQTELDRFETLLGDLLEISRYDAGAAVLESESVDMRTLIHRVVSATLPLAARQGSEIVLHLPSGPVVAEVDSRRVERVLRNLVGNAVEHGEGLPVEVTLAGDDHAVAISVRDHGIGLAPGEGALVFNRFWRADPSRNRRTGGTGLGLSISLEDARLHGGWLQAWGRAGAGSQFRLTLPRRRGQTLVRSPLPLQPRDADTLVTGRTPQELEAT